MVLLGFTGPRYFYMGIYVRPAVKVSLWIYASVRGNKIQPAFGVRCMNLERSKEKMCLE